MATDGTATWWNATSGAPAYNAQDLRQIDSLEVMPGPASEPFSGRPGRRVNGKGLEVSVSSTGNGTVTVSPGVCLLYASAQAVQGVWRATFPQIGPIALGARPAAGQSRIVLVLARLYDGGTNSSGIGSVKEAKIELLAGSDNASPSPPAIPAGAVALVLDTLTVPSSGTITHVQTTQRTVAAGGILPVATVGERDQLKTDGIAYEGMYVDVASTDSLERFDGTNWVPAKDSITRLFTRSDATASYAQGGAIGALTFPAIPVASRVVVDAQGLIGFVGQTNQIFRLSWAVTGGTLVDPTTQEVYTTTGGTWVAYVKAGYVDIPANTAVTLTSYLLTTAAGGGYWGGLHKAQRYLAGEYA